MKLTGEYEAHIESLEKIGDFLARCLDRDSLSPTVFSDLKLAIEEIFTNIVKHGLQEQQGAMITINLQVDDDAVQVEICDPGIAFNPLNAADPDLYIPLEERKLGGLGIFLVKQLMDNVSYRRDENRNILTIKKNIC